ncbi:MAG: FtsX-like permease family protein [Bacteroidota bacterium]
MDTYRELQNSIDSEWPIQEFDFVSLNDLHLSSDQISNDISSDTSTEGRVSLPIIAAFLLILACCNYINIAIVSGTKRLKEIGLRKVIGANKRLIIAQLFTENLALTAVAAVIGFVLAISIILPWFASFAPVASQFDLLDPQMWLFLVLILFITAILSGLYPAFYISKFESVQIFRGTLKFGRKNILTKVFLTLQLAVTCIGIAFAVMLARNSDYQMKRGWGYNQHDLLYHYTPDYATYQQLEKAMTEHPTVKAVAGSQHHFTKAQENATLQLPDKKIEIKRMAVGENYLQSLKVPLLKGRYLMEDGQLDRDKALINEQLAKSLAVKDPVGKKVRINDCVYEIVGILEDVHFYNFYYPINPTLFTTAAKEDYRYISIKVNPGTQYEAFDHFEAVAAELYPDMPFLGGYQEDLWNGFYLQLEVQRRFSRIIAILFIILSSLGLYGLIQLNLAGRIKEFSIRKTLGAGKFDITAKIFGQYLLIFEIAVAVGAPAGYYLNDALLNMMFEGPRPSGLVGAVMASILLIIILVAVVYSQVNNVIKTNPIKGLKAE